LIIYPNQVMYRDSHTSSQAGPTAKMEDTRTVAGMYQFARA
jgi:hypothetical protein